MFGWNEKGKDGKWENKEEGKNMTFHCTRQSEK